MFFWKHAGGRDPALVPQAPPPPAMPSLDRASHMTVLGTLGLLLPTGGFTCPSHLASEMKRVCLNFVQCGYAKNRLPIFTHLSPLPNFHTDARPWVWGW